MKKINTLVPINHPLFKINLGTFDKKNPSVVFVEGSGYITPKREMNFEELHKDLSSSFSRLVKNMISSTGLFSSPFISNVDFPYERMKIGKKTYLTFEFHLIQKKVKDIIGLSEYKDEFVTGLLDDFAEDVQDMDLEISKTK